MFTGGNYLSCMNDELYVRRKPCALGKRKKHPTEWRHNAPCVGHIKSSVMQVKTKRSEKKSNDSWHADELSLNEHG
jgi:hypothetical protein